MWKFWRRRLGASGSSSSVRSLGSASVQGSVADLREKFFLEKHGTHGFPFGPTAMSYDPCRHVLFIGTTTGELKMYGRPGVELTALHPDFNKVLQILPFSSEPAVMTICSNNMMHKWTLSGMDGDGTPHMSLKRTYKFQGGLAKTITVCCLPPFCDCLFVGTLGGITYPMDTEFDGMSPEVLSWSRARAYLGYKGKDVPGEVRALEINPAQPKELLIGYEHSYLEIWDAMTWKPRKIFGPFKDCGDLNCVGWHSNGSQFLTSHKNGSVCVWSVDSADTSNPLSIKAFYSSTNLQEATRILWPEESLIIACGGAPYDLVDGDSVTIHDREETTTLQLTSGVRSMHILEDCQTDKDSGIVGATSDMETVTTVRKVLILLLEQEALFVELRLPDLPLLQPPYLNSIHNSPVKECAVFSEVDKQVWSILSRVGKVQQEDIYRAPCKVWPIDGGVIQEHQRDNRDLFITGHEDGSVKFWDVRDVSMRLMYVVKCGTYFNKEEEPNEFRSDSPNEEQLPQCRQVGFWDPRSDDDQLIVTSIHFCGEQLLVGFQGGHALMLNINNQTADCTIILMNVSIMREDPRQRGRAWQAPLQIRTDPIECSPGYQPSHCVHFFPAVQVTALAIDTEHKLLGAGCTYGFVVVDYTRHETIYVHCTFDLEIGDPTTMSRVQSIRRSFRQSLTRMNIRHSMRGMQSTNRSFRPGQHQLARSGSARPSFMNRVASIRGKGATNVSENQAKQPPPRRDSIRSIMFLTPTHVSGSSLVNSLLVGTNQGSVLGFTVDIPHSKNKEIRVPVIMPVEKEFNQKRNLAVLFAGVIDGLGYLLDVNEQGNFKPKGNHFMVICTEDMLRVTSIPNQKKKFRVKFKQAEDDEYHAVSAHFLRVAGQSTMMIMDSDGYLSVYTLPELKLLYKENCVDAADAIGQRHFVCSTTGLLLHQKSPAEFTRGSITDQHRVEVNFSLPCKPPSFPSQGIRLSRPLSEGPHLVEIGQEETTDGVEANGPLSPGGSSTYGDSSRRSEHHARSETSLRSQGSVESPRRSTVELPDHYFQRHHAELKEAFQERAL